MEDLVHFIEAEPLPLVQLIYVDLFRVNEKQAKSHDFDQHVLFRWGQIVLALKHLEANVDDVTEKVFVVLHFLQVF